MADKIIQPSVFDSVAVDLLKVCFLILIDITGISNYLNFTITSIPLCVPS